MQVCDEFLETCGDGFQGEDDLHHLRHVAVDPEKQAAGGKLRSGIVPSSPRKLEVKRIDETNADKKVKRYGPVFSCARVVCLALVAAAA